MQWHQQRGLQEAQTQRQIDMKRRRQRIALIERLWNRAAGFAQPRIVNGDTDQPLRAMLQGLLENGTEQILRFPPAAGMEKVLCAPTAVLAAVGPDDAGQAATAQADQRTERLTDSAMKSALLGEHIAPAFDDGEECGEQAHFASGSREKVFFSGRRKRSPRATFLVSEETRLSRSTVTPNWAWMRSRMSETWRGVRAFLSMS
jgi:hypothetical protein